MKSLISVALLTTFLIAPAYAAFLVMSETGPAVRAVVAIYAGGAQ
jgi:hypothetical protein